MQTIPASAFSSNDEAAITRPLDLEEQEKRTGIQRREEDVAIEEFYEIEETVAQIQQRQFKRIALQFPDEMLSDSVAVYLALGSRLKDAGYSDCNLFVLADTSYGSCCTDEVAAQHINADVVIHYGHACLSATTRLPTIYIYGKRSIDTENVVHSFKASIGDTMPQGIILRTDVSYSHAAEEIAERLRTTFPNISISKNDLPRIQEPRQGPHISNGPPNAESSILQATSVASSGTVLFIGPESLALTNLLMTKSSAQVYRYDPRDRRCDLESTRTNKLLMRRYAVMQRARDADVFGILVGTLGVASYLHLITEVRKMLAREGKKTYTISVGKLNPAKLANFAEIECFVLIACPENSIVESKEFLRPIVTPFELSIALGVAPSWDGRYLLDFGEVLVDCRTQERDASAKDDKEEEEEEVQPEFSLITGKYRQVKRYGQRAIPEGGLSTGDEGALIARNNEGTVAQVIESASGDFMRNRTWQGLEQRLGEDEPGLLEQGRSGIARGYHEVER